MNTDVASFIDKVIILPLRVALVTNLFSSTPNVVTSVVKEVPSFNPNVKALPVKLNEFTKVSLPPPPPVKPEVLVNTAFNSTIAVLSTEFT